MASKRPPKSADSDGRPAGEPPRSRTKDGARRSRRSEAVPREGNPTLVRPPARSSRPSPPSSGIRARVDVREHGVAIIGSAKAVEDFLDGREIDRRLADPEA